MNRWLRHGLIWVVSFGACTTHEPAISGRDAGMDAAIEDASVDAAIDGHCGLDTDSSDVEIERSDVQVAYVKASNTDADDYFGSRVAISGDTLVVGAPGEASSATGINGDQTDNSASASGAVYVFIRDGDSWTQQAYLKASTTTARNGFGNALAIDGDTIVVGAPLNSSNATGINGDQASTSEPLRPLG